MIILWDSSAMTVTIRCVSDTVDETSKWEANRDLSRDMLGYLRHTLSRYGMTFADISGIGVNRGPGSFTGLRIGMVVLNTLADSLHVPIVGVSGDDWQTDALARLRAGENDRIVMPDYGGEAHITKPRK